MNRLKKAADSAENLINTPDGGQQNNTTNDSNNNANNNANQKATDNKNTDNANQDSKIAVDLLERINTSVDDIRDTYYSLLDNLNAINESYPNLYTELKQLVKLPDENEIREIVDMQKDVKGAVKYLQDPNFLNGIIKK